MKPFRKPDLNAPRFRPKRHMIVGKKFYNDFRTEHPQYAYLTDQQILETITTFNGIVWQQVLDTRDGVELFENLGVLFIGACPRKKFSNPDYKKSAELGFLVQHKNWETDEQVGKIIYTNYDKRYKFQFYNLWMFEGVRQFKRTVPKVFPERYTSYIVVDRRRKINRILKS
jgi:hypothetical protein